MIHLKDINIVIPCVKPRRFLHLSDPHIAYYYPGDDPEYVKYAKYYSSAWGTEDKSSNENFEDFLSLAVSEKPDAVTIAGDLQDACSVSNVKYLVEKLSDFPVEYLYVYGNHEPEAHDPAWLDDDLKKRAETARLVGKHPEFFVKDYGDLLIIGIDDSDRTVSPEQREMLKKELSRCVPALVLIHVPLPIPSFEEEVKRKNEDFNYYLFGHEKPSALTREFYELLTSGNSPVYGILSGHVHFVSETEYLPGRKQITSAPGRGWRVTING